MTPRLESVQFDIDGQTIAGIRHSDANGDTDVRMLCLHGWLDNAASFLPLMPHLPAIDMVAIDMPGHGHSFHVTAESITSYSVFDYACNAVRVLDILGWDSCHLLGHSLGACIAPLIAVSVDDRIETITMIDAAGPLSEAPEKQPERTARAMRDRLSPQRFQSRLFETREAAVDARLAAATMARTSARLIIDRQVSEVEGSGFRWRFDPALRYASPQYLSEEQVQAILSAVDCPVLSVVAEEGFLVSRGNTDARLGCLRDHRTVQLSGYHHVHMDTPEPVAAAINAFLGTRPALV